MAVSETNPLLPRVVKDNGENTMTSAVVGVGCLLDGVGGVRQIGFATAASASLASSVATSAIATTAASMGLLCSGPLSMAFSAVATIPDARSFVVKAEGELLSSLRNCRDLEKRKTDPRVLSAKRMLTIRKMGVVNQSTLFAMGAIQTACGVVYMLGSEAASLFHFSTVLSGATAVLASTVTSVALGAIYIFRGTMMIYRSCLALSIVGNFKNAFKACKNLTEQMDFLVKEEKNGAAYMQPRVDASCLETTVNGNVCTMTALGYKFADGHIQAYSNASEKQEYIQRVEKGIFSEQLKHRLCATIGVTMIIGGGLTLALTVLSHGIAPIAISLASAIFFMLAENIFLSYDAPQVFEWMRDRLFSFTQAGASSRVESDTAPRHRVAFTENADMDAASTAARTRSVSSSATDLDETTLFLEIFAERARAATA